MKYLSVCSGIEAASAAWQPLGWQPVAFSEIEPYPCSVLAHHHPAVPNWGDMTKFEEWPDEPIDLLCGGTPCQSFSVAGLRKGLADPRGNLMLTFGAIAAKYRPRWLVWENVPGVLSSNGGRDFGSFLGLLGELGYGFAYRVLDAQYVRVESHPRAVPQRRRRVFVVGHSGGQWQRAAAVLFERESLCGHPAPRREAGQVAPTIPARSTAGGGLGTDFDCDGGLQVAGTMKACKDSGGWSNSADHAYTLEARAEVQAVAVAFVATGQAGAGWAPPSFPVQEECSQTLDTRRAQPVMTAMQVRRLTPVECEKLQGFEPGYTAIPWRKKPADQCPDGPRYRALDNSWAVNCARWIGERIEQVESIKVTQARNAGFLIQEAA